MHSSFAARLASPALGALLLLAAGSVEAQALTGSVTLDQASPTLTLPLDCGIPGSSHNYYKTVDFTVDTDGTYTIETTGNEGVGGHADPFVLFYEPGAVDFTNPEGCTVAADDTVNGSVTSTEASFDVQLLSGAIYTLIVTTPREGDTGDISYSVSGVGAVSARPALNRLAVTDIDPNLTAATARAQSNGMTYLSWVVVPAGATAPNSSQITSGTNGSGGNPIASGMETIVQADSDVAFTIQNLSPSTQYDLYANSYFGVGGGIRKTSFSTDPPIDTTPDPFTFVPQYGLPLNTVCVSNTVTLTGINMSVPITVTGGFYAIDWDGTIDENDDVTDQNASLGTGHTITAFVMNTAMRTATTSTATVTVAGTPYPFSCTTVLTNRLITAQHFNGEDGNCSEGGVRLFIGDDQNGNDRLDSQEPSDEYFVCNASNIEVTSDNLDPDPDVCPTGGVHVQIGAPNSGGSSVDPNLPPLSPPPPPPPPSATFDLCNGLNSLIKTEKLGNDDAECENGGIRVTTWTDNNADGELNQNEPSLTQKVCNGIDGDSGHDSLIETTALAAKSEECPTGGFLVKAGTDLDRDKKLEAEEVSTTRKVCNAVQQLSRTSDIDHSNACPHGGKKVETGTDDNGNHELDDAEVTATTLVCNGESTAVRTREITTHTHDCPAGGTVLETGIDKNGDGELDDDEVEKSEQLCGPASLLFETLTIGENDEDCPHGGLRVRSGHDDGRAGGFAGDGVLEEGEIEVSKSVCLAPTEVLVSGGDSSCSVTTPGGHDSSSTLASGLFVLVGVALRLRRRTRARNN